jgi:hypothetical protein
MNMNLPVDLVDFLRNQHCLNYDSDLAEPGFITLHLLDHLSVSKVFIDSEGTPLRETDPHAGERGYYSVPAVNLVAACEGYDPDGILIWLPDLRQFGSWDNDHWDVFIFPGITWSKIVANPLPFINAQWHPGRVKHDFLAPWPQYPFQKGRPWEN